MPGPDSLLKDLGGKPTPKEALEKLILDEAIRPPNNLPGPINLLPCPCCGSTTRTYYQEQHTNQPSVLCPACGCKTVLDIDPTGKVMPDNWNKRHSHQHANDETDRWLAIIDMNLRDDDGGIHDESWYDPYTFALVMRLFQDLIIRKDMLIKNMVVCPFCGAPDFMDFKGSLKCANPACAALIPTEYFNCLIEGKKFIPTSAMQPAKAPDTDPVLPAKKPVRIKKITKKAKVKKRTKRTSK